MVPEKSHGISDSVIQGISDRTAPSGVRAIDPDLQPAVLDVAVQIKVGDAGLNEGEISAFIDLENFVHALQIDDHTAAQFRRRSAIRKILAGGNWEQRYLVAIGCPDDGLYLFHCGRGNRSRWNPFVRRPPNRRKRVPVRI